MALGMYRHAVDIDLGPNPFSSNEGIHSAAMGGIWQCGVCGFAGLKWEEEMLSMENHLPDTWKSMEFRICWRGAEIKVRLEKGLLSAEHLGGPGIDLKLNGRKYILSKGAKITDGYSKKNIPKYKGVIFDLDGVLCHTDRFHYRAWKKVADELGIPFDETINRRLRGVSRMESLEIILENSGEKFSEEKKQELAEEKNTYYRKLLSEMTPSDMTPQVRDMLTVLKKRGIRLAVGSSSKNAPFILERLEAKNEFDAVCDGTMITQSKPHPEVFLKAAQMLGLKPEECMVVEDAPAGLEAAKAAGMDCAVIGQGEWPSSQDFELESADQLKKIFG